MTASLVRAYVLVIATVGFQPALAFAQEPELQEVVVVVATEDDPGVYRPSFISFDSTAGEIELFEGTAQYESVGRTFRYTFADGTEISGAVANIQINREALHFSAIFTIDSGPDSGTYHVSMTPTDADAGLGLVEITDSTGATISTPIAPQMYAQGVGGTFPGYALGMHPAIAIAVIGIALFIVAEEAFRGGLGYNCAGFAYYYNGCWM